MPNHFTPFGPWPTPSKEGGAASTSGKSVCQPAVRIKNRAGFWSLDDALDPYELHDIALCQKW